MSVISKKICIIGEPEVGKNSLMCHSADKQFSDAYLEAVGVKIFQKNIEFQGSTLPQKLNLQLLIWNITGNDKFKAIAPAYWQGSCGAVAVADVSRPETIVRLSEYVELFLSVNPAAFIIIALNKADLIEQEKLEKLIQLIDLQQISGIYPTSAKTGLYVDEIFLQIAYKIIESWDASSSLQISVEPEDTADLTIGGDRETGRQGEDTGNSLVNLSASPSLGDPILGEELSRLPLFQSSLSSSPPPQSNSPLADEDTES